MNDHMSLIIGTLIGGGITLFVTVIQNIFAAFRQNTEIEHDRQVKQKTREMNLRREIYFDAIDAIAKSIHFVANIVEMDLKEMSKDSAYLSACFQKVQLIACTELLEKFNDCTSMTSDAYISLIPLKIKIQGLQIEIQSANDLRKMALEESRNITLKMEELNKEKDFNSDKWDSLKELLKKYQQDQKDQIKISESLNKEIFDKKMELTKESILCLRELTVAAGEVIICMRNELSLEGDSEIVEFLRGIIKQSNDKSFDGFENFLNQIDDLIEDSA